MALETWNDESFVHAAALLLWEREARLGAIGAWSIAELQLTEHDYVRLLGWARGCHPGAIARALETIEQQALPPPCAERRYPTDVLVGLVLLALFAETLGREGSSDGPWPSIAQTLDGTPVFSVLFHPSGAPRPALKEALRKAAVWFQLRAGDLEDPESNRWYQLLLLQSGICRRDVESHLPQWLQSLDPTFQIGRLCQEDKSFRDAWQALARHRRNKTTRDRALRAVQNCPFFRGDADAVVNAALREAPLVGVAEPAIERAALEAGLALTWPQEAFAPRAVLSIVFADDEALGARVLLSIDGVFRTAYRRRDGRLTCCDPRVLTVQPAVRWALLAQSPTAEDLALATVDLFEDDAPTACFDERGARCDERAAAVRLVATRERVATTPIGPTYWDEAQGVAIARVGPGSTVASLDGTLLWPPEPSALLDDARDLALEVREVIAGGPLETVTIELAHAPAVRVLRARIGANAFAPTPCDARATRLQGVVPASEAAPAVALRLWLAHGTRRLQRTIRLRVFTGAAIDGAWLDPECVVEASRLRGGALRLCLSRAYEGHDARLSAATHTLRVDPDAPRAIRAPALGFGEPLVLCDAEPWATQVPLTLIGRIEDHGEVVRHELRDGQLIVEHRLELDDWQDHWMLVWPRAGAPVKLPLSPERAAGGSCLAAAYASPEPPRAVALGYGHAILGSSWADDWSEDLPRAVRDPWSLVAFVRLLKLPALASPHRERVVAALQGLGPPMHAVFAAALHRAQQAPVAEPPAGMLDALASRREREAWDTVLRVLLLEVRLTNALVSDLADEAKAWQSAKLGALAGARTAGPADAASVAAFAARREQMHQLGLSHQMALLGAGAVHPVDANRAAVAHHGGVDLALSRHLADASLGLVHDCVLTLSSRQQSQRRTAALRAARGRWIGDGPGVDTCVDEARRWSETLDAPLSPALRAALVDARMHRRIQIELLNELA